MKNLHSKHKPVVAVLVAACGLTLVGRADAAEPVTAPATDTASPHTFAVGYKIGNGLGFTGAEVVFGLGDHLSLGLQANYISVQDDLGETVKGYGVLPFAQYRFFKAGSSPYVSAGPLYIQMALGDVSASATGVVGNLGWEWIWKSGLSVNVGAGVGHLGTIKATNGVSSIDVPGATMFNIESALRYYFM
jgi:hypothetical protein